MPRRLLRRLRATWAGGVQGVAAVREQTAGRAVARHGGRVPARIRRNPRIAAQRYTAQGGPCGDPGVRPRLRRRPTSPKVVTGRVVRATLAAPYRPRPGARRAGRHGRTAACRRTARSSPCGAPRSDNLLMLGAARTCMERTSGLGGRRVRQRFRRRCSRWQ